MPPVSVRMIAPPGALMPTAWPLASSYLGREQIAFVEIVIRTRGFELFAELGKVAQQHVDQSVGTERKCVRTVFAHLAAELDHGLDVVGPAVLIVVAQAIQRGALRDRRPRRRPCR